MASAAVVSVTMGVMKPVLEKLSTLMGDEYKKIKGLRKEVSFLRDELRAMDALLEKMDAADRLDPQAKEWRRDIIDMSYDIEDCIDDFMHRVGEPGDKVGVLQKASGFLKTFKDRYRIANQIKKIKTRVIQAANRRERYKLDVGISINTPVDVDPRLSALYKDSTTLVGIDIQKEEIVKWAMDEEQQLKVMSIVGFGGLGKTTLANEVYREVGGHFSCKALVCVSQTPNVIKLLNSILLQLGLNPHYYSHFCEMDLINKIKEHLEDKRYLIIIDDLWDSQPWKTIICAFPRNNHHCRVVVTTRNENVATSCSGNHGMIYNMKPLSEPDSRKLFFNIIFGPEGDCPSQLAEISSEILKKCRGLPLAIIAMASILASSNRTKQKEEWEYIRKELATKFATNSDYEDMMNILDLSYKNLPRHLKACFLYLGSYPEDHEINRVNLVRQWVAEGFVSSSSSQDVWDVADSYFNELVNRSMIQPINEDRRYKPDCCRVHDMLLELIARRCKEDNFLRLVNVDDPYDVAQAQDKVIHRLTVVSFGGANEDGKVARTTVGSCLRIRSLTVFGISNRMGPLLEFKLAPLLKFKFLRVLFLELGYTKVDLTDINQLSQLRYLLVKGYSIAELHLQIKRLQLLETLDLSDMSASSSIETADAPRLSHVMIPDNMRIIGCIGKFKLLRTLHGFTLPSDNLESIIGLGELIDISDLALCSPRWRTPLGEATTWMEAVGTSLEKLINLRRLCVSPYRSFPEEYVAWRADTWTSLSFSFHNLEELYLRNYTFSRVPEWIGHLKKLRVLTIGVKQIFQEDVVIIGAQLPSLLGLSLRIPGIPVGRMVVGGAMAFPAIEWFEFDCDKMSDLAFEEGAMPRLRELVLSFDVDKWDKASPGGLQHLPSLEKIEVRRVFTTHNNTNTKEEEECALIRGVFEGAAAALPTRPVFTFDESWLWSPTEEEDYLKSSSSSTEGRCLLAWTLDSSSS